MTLLPARSFILVFRLPELPGLNVSSCYGGPDALGVVPQFDWSADADHRVCAARPS